MCISLIKSLNKGMKKYPIKAKPITDDLHNKFDFLYMINVIA